MENDGAWHISTFGHFISLLIDCEHNPGAIAYRISEESVPDRQGEFVRTMEITVYPNGYVRDAVEGCRTIHKTLLAMMEAEIIK